MKLYEIFNQIDIDCDIKHINDFEVRSILPLNLAGKEDISYLDKDKYLPLLENCKAGAVLIHPKHKDSIPSSVKAVFVENPHLVFAYISQIFGTTTFSKAQSSISNNPNAVIMPNVFIGENVAIGDGSVIMPNAVIADNVIIGENCKIYPNVVIYQHTNIGNNVNIHAGSVIGCDGFGYAHTQNGEHIKIEHLGGVIIEDDVEIGANVAIDRAVFENTIIKKGAKIDNLVQIGHNCVIGEYTILVSQVGFAGSTTTGRNVVCGGQAGTGGHVHIGDFVQVAGRGAVSKDLPPYTKWGGHPIMELGKWQKFHASLRRLVGKK